MPFGQLVIGPAGSGKTTYCNGMQQYLTLTGRKTAVVNLDPANDALPYDCAVDISELVALAEVQDNLKLGPNGGSIHGLPDFCAAVPIQCPLHQHQSEGYQNTPSKNACLTKRPPDTGLIYCIDYLDQNLDWLQEKLESVQKGVQLLLHCHACLLQAGWSYDVIVAHDACR